VGHQSPDFGECTTCVARWNRMAHCHDRKLDAPTGEEWVWRNKKGVSPRARERGKSLIDLAASAGLEHVHLPLPRAGSRLHAARHLHDTSSPLLASLGLTSTPNRVAAGTSSCRTPMRFATNSAARKLTPVTLPPGRVILATRPSATGSSASPKTIGIVEVAALAASAPGSVKTVITLARRRTKSAANSGRRSYWPSAQRYSMMTLRPST